MRLGQLARRLSLRPAQIVEFLANNNIQIEPNSNTRLDDGHVSIIVQHYAPESLAIIESEPDEVVVEETIPVVEVAQPVTVIDPVHQPETEEAKTAEEIEVIRVQKIELSGLKVLGKIELPEPKKKETVVEEPKSEEIVEGQKSIVDSPQSTVDSGPLTSPIKSRNSNKKPKQQNRERSQQRPWKNPLEVQREREAKAAEEKKRREIELERERRKKHYEEKVKSVGQPKRVKPTKAQPEAKKKPVDTRPVPKTWFGKFLRWWTT